MTGLRIVSWLMLLSCAVYWMIAENNGEMFVGGMFTVLSAATTVRIHPQPFNRILRWLGIIE